MLLNTPQGKVLLKNVLYVKDFAAKIVSVGKLLRMNKGAIMACNENEMTIQTKDKKLLFVKKGLNEDSVLYFMKGTVIKKMEPNQELVMTGTTRKKKKVEINHAHKIFGHPNARYTKLTAKLAGWELFGQFKICEACAKAKTKAKGVSKTAKMKAESPGQRLFVDISGPYAKSVIGNKYWVMVVDDFS